MLDAFAFILFAAAAVGCGLLAVRVILAAEAARHREVFSLTFPRSVDPAQITAALRSVQGLLPRFPDRLVVTRPVGFETVATAAGIAHYLSAPAGKGDLVVGQLRAAIPGLRVLPAAAPDRYASLARELTPVGVGSLQNRHDRREQRRALGRVPAAGAGRRGDRAVVAQPDRDAAGLAASAARPERSGRGPNANRSSPNCGPCAGSGCAAETPTPCSAGCSARSTAPTPPSAA